MRKLKAEYNRKKRHIKKRLREFGALCDACDEEIFSELCFCILTPQTKAVNCDKVIKDLRRNALLFSGCKDEISERLKGFVRFHNNKAAYIVEARNLFRKDKRIDIKSRLSYDDIAGTREWLVKNIKGLGYKEASHFLRNVGLGKGIAIIDRHILKNLKKHGAIKELPRSISRKTYLEIEGKMRKFSRKAGIPIEELDLLFWSAQTGFIFK